MICKIIDIISKLNYKTHIINASSCEIYKGNGNNIHYLIQENDINYNPTHPYAYSKLLAHNMIKYYRENKNMLTSNAILFTTESPYRKDNFLLKKCVNHIKNLKDGNTSILTLGNLDSYRNINHAFDVCNALILIGEQNSDDYLVCSDNYICVKDIIIKMYKYSGIDLIEDVDNELFYYNSKIVIEFNKYKNNFIDSNLNGNCQKLKSLGWKPIFNTELIFKDILNFL